MERHRQGFMTTASDKRRAQAVSRREEELADGFAEVRYTGFVTVSAQGGGQELECDMGRSSTQANWPDWSSNACTESRRRPSRTRCHLSRVYVDGLTRTTVTPDRNQRSLRWGNVLNVSSLP
jgi:hypothetical protein